ncbi:MAG: bifunctional phosphopantothenoylcysteine decarboxylase/phosphopantothenate--cysteine ligase CoaBC [Crocinitomicaceae bacterium TMED135]|nr:MAG: bifunctional phosphopantothenoylcysteine decarboxylase/phosphopantothenate--cysteine ligase CoaBC [Crocinitomicaceae bacterium TMED135]|tara:strand:- start:4003 stop:5193 length:1191 start_codon:yes stop_codon:yes gene_type:complete
MLSGKNVLLAITGSIAAYKSAYLVRELIKRGAKVKVIITEAALKFVTTVTLSTLSKNPVYKDFLKNTDTGEWNNHVELGSWSDIMIVAPATANTLSNLVYGKGDSFFLATYLSCKAPIFVAPAMDLDMYKNESTQNNIKILKDRKINIIEPRSGELASGLDGKGRMEEPEQITKIINQYFLDKATLKNLKILISAGPTYESIDPVRFIGNHSSGKMGFALAREAEKRGANVELIAGPVSLETPRNVQRINVSSADEMKKEIEDRFKNTDVLIMSAAVSDYQPLKMASNKIKKDELEMSISLKKTPDILKDLAKLKKKQIVIGFALETQSEKKNAYEKMKKKNLDAIILNSLNDKGSGFGFETNKITLITPLEERKFDLKSKDLVAVDILNFVEECI